jgi:hypothetical protein
MASHGGIREGSGRPAGAVNKATSELKLNLSELAREYTFSHLAAESIVPHVLMAPACVVMTFFSPLRVTTSACTREPLAIILTALIVPIFTHFLILDN